MVANYLPLFIRADRLRVLIVGFGKVGSQRAKRLRDLGSEVTVVSLEDVKEEGINAIKADARSLEIDFFRRFNLVIAATGNKELNREVCNKAREAGVLCDDPLAFESSDVILPVYYATENYMVAVTSYGYSTLFAKEILEKIRGTLESDPGLRNLGEAAKLLKPLLKSNVGDPKIRYNLYHLIYNDGEFREKARKGDLEGAKNRALEVIKNAAR